MVLQLNTISKNLDISYTEWPGNIPGIVLHANEDSTKLNTNASNDYTTIVFPVLSGWKVIANNNTKYTITLVLIKSKGNTL